MRNKKHFFLEGSRVDVRRGNASIDNKVWVHLGTLVDTEGASVWFHERYLTQHVATVTDIATHSKMRKGAHVVPQLQLNYFKDC